MMNCSRIDCGHKATKWPLVSFAAKANPLGPRPEFKFPLAVCDAHAEPDPALYVSDEGWKQIVDEFAGRGLAQPDRTTLRVDFVPCQ
jgi:hypothetical protein